MRRAPALALAAALLGAAAPALAGEAAGAPRQIPCALGPHGKIGHINAERVTARLDSTNERDLRYEYRAVLRNPNLAPAEVAAELDMAGLVPASGRAVVIPPRGAVEVLLGWVPVSNPIRRGAPPAPQEVLGHFTLGQCRIAGLAGPAV
jgi:hypothetical protein